MKKSKIYLIFMLCISSLIVLAKKQDEMNALLGIKVKNIEIIKDLEKTWIVVGEIENVKDQPIQGSVKIKFLNSQGVIIHVAYAKVNLNEPIQTGESGKFAYFTDAEKFHDVVGFKILFKKG